ncbi:transcriptional activator FtrB [Caulobacter vibrioides]|uniref:Transcriptional activator, putative n=2 Tax=Caulobacter vibrioides TaxID=155892 RepID=Q9A8E4_CAUVC|nr:transcriptional activator FtrB [Caulobacter vibrioides]YP_002516849.1 CRP-family transcription regulator FtrB [Caulobacter vibrioides NA1000]AAK23391.1 transcriptional activator, putative [Caulobacter vibrioides CB15]ACL94941.1 CRP-family transcription regulator FtrB [Caulobacter vibrioides NA1000]ATC28219.1 transcriptional regulator [Caulobacter vibrioides]QXZ53485.1 transcriptional activator FtrB [Caulobacter vibrioides]
MSLEAPDLLRIRALPLFEAVNDGAFDRLMRGAFLQRFPRGSQLTTQGQPDNFLFVLLEGAIELEGSSSDRESTLALLWPSASLCLASIVLDGPSLMTARTTKGSLILMVPGDAFRQALEEDAGLGRAVAEELAGCFSGAVRSLKNNKLRTARERLVSYLLAQHQRQGGGAVVKLPCRKRVLASLLGMTPENLSRAFASLGPHGVEIDGSTVTLREPEGLAQLARPDPMIDNPIGESFSQAERERRRGGRTAIAAH